MVEWKKLWEVEDSGILTLGRGQVISKIDMNDCPGDFPVYSSSSQNNGEIGRYGKYMFDDERITWSIDGGGKLFYRNGLKYSVTNVCGWLKVNDGNKLNTKFLYYLLFEEWSNIIFDYNHKAHPSVIRNEYQIPVIPLDEQTRIVGILDTFTASIGNLKEQITQRRKQYEYYRDQLLDLEGKEGVEMKSLKKIVKSYCTGATPKKGTLEYYEGGTVPWLRTQDVKFNEIYTIDSYVTNEAVEKTGIKWIPANCVIIAISGATAGRCAINKIPTTTNQHCLNLEINPEEALYKYVYYCVYNAYDKMISKKQGVRGDLNSSIILGIKLPVPSLGEQSRIVSILDTFESSIQNLEAQLKEREKQYEYYRNKLLTFE